MKSVLISIQPKWVEKIARGEKTIEVRRTKPKIETPFKCYIYCGMNSKNEDLLLVDKNGRVFFGDYRNACNCDIDGNVDCYIGESKVIGEFVCDRIIEWECKNRLELVGELGLPNVRASYMCFVDDLEKTCLTYDDLWDYGKGKTLYGWHISDLKIYDKPKELNEFTPICKYKNERCEICNSYVETFGGCCQTLTRPPQSWCYVEGEQ